MSRKRIFLLASVGLGQEYGLKTYINTLTNEARKYGSKIEIIVVNIRFSDCLESAETNIEGNVSYVIIPVLCSETDFWDDPIYLKGFLAWIGNRFSLKNDDIFHFNSFSGLDIAFLLKNDFGVKIIYTVHFSTWKSYFENEGELESNWLKASKIKKRQWHYLEIEFQMLEISDSIVCLSKETERILSTIFKIDEKKLLYLPNFLPEKTKKLVDNTLLTSLRTDTKIIMYCGRMDDDKGIRELLEACNNLFVNNKDCTLLLVGGGDISHLLGGLPNLWERLIYTGYITDRKVLDNIIALADIQVLVSRHEQSSFTLLEGLRSKNAMIISDIPAFEDIDDCICIKITESTSSSMSKQLEEKLSILLENTDLIEELGHKGYSYFMENLTADKNFPVLCKYAYGIRDLVG
ncbi:glycosyltransferase family 4 protein [Sphingobacterium sp. DR205]|uniref:glycosyltransferase family 4 protein n=1 Tax=Sphingobacterium sp. DR205 TaxID=2713573 RepID=UPI0013E4B6D6|nr:glycosyltransferase family 4 protein [Sphingobacterium sp. DR205]QIH36744.1 glycosyltransferase [Sphingobacterium sp. DR205]